MPKRKENSIRIFWMENEKEKSVRIYPKNVPEKKWENGFELYLYGLTSVCHYFNVLVPDDLEVPVRWCYEYIPFADINPDLSWKEKCDKIYNTEEYQYWYKLKREAYAAQCADSMFSDAYKYLIEACRCHENGEDVDTVDENLISREWKEPFWSLNMFEDYVGLQTSRADTGAWIFRDGSYITLEAGNHRRLVEEYMNLKELDMERWWVKIQLYCAYTHNRMTDAQKKTLNKFFKRYEDLYERNLEDW